ncbi:Trk system potassium uptake protein TrkA [Fulvivirga imtechensis AK7]|uniref:Trk system potassium uptake protein TrkA n=1 Tax=Fulvivirga imtechensis AK7 TaxID=1237149 RepID=L8JR09_9BACT|nr:Trk system potassium transporter TrkA [Fulvivirga imtechensis]ELR71411.1 Trk system potassium uptake protein TrkA [Fulvivirga imtechensis AK7]
MRIIIAGAGDVGFHLAKLLAYEKQDIILIDKDADTLAQAGSSLDVGTIKGSSTSYKVLEEADVKNADLLIAVTSSEETNLTTAMIGKHLGAKKTIARIQNVEYLLDKEKLDLKDLGIDEIISPESLAAKEIKRLLKEVAVTDTFDFDQGKLSLIGVTIDENSQLRNKSMIEVAHLNPHQNFVTVAILRQNNTIIPHGENRFMEGDHAYFIAQPDGVDRVLELSGKEQKQEIKNIMILGGSKVGFHAAKRLSRKYNVKLIESDKDKCFELADELRNVMVISGDGRDIELLEEEGIDEMDAFIAVTGNSETNIISCLVAKNHNVKKTISLVENIDYIHLSQNIGVDTMINKKLIAANFIFRYIRKGEVISLTSIHGVDAEILEFIVKAGSKITEREIRELDFPRGAIIGGVVRNGVGYTTMGDFQFRPKDRAVVLCRPECIRAVERFFK